MQKRAKRCILVGNLLSAPTMTVKVKLWTYEPAANGDCDLKLYINQDGKRKYISLGLKINPKDWDNNKEQVRRSHPLSVVMNARIQKAKNEAITHLLQGGSPDGLTDQKTGSFLAFTNAYIEEMEKGLTTIRPGTQNVYRAFRRRLEEYLDHHDMRDITFSQIDLNWYLSFREFICADGTCTIQGGFSKHIKICKRLMNISRSRGLHDCSGHEHKDFKVYRNYDAGKIYLTEEEIQLLIAVDLSTESHLGRERDRFIVSYYLLLRFSDSTKVRRDWFFEENGQWYYRNKALKTGAHSIIPVKPIVHTILSRLNWDLSGDTNAESNRKLKHIAARAGLHQLTNEGGRQGPKWSFVTTHTARRSAATNLHLAGVSHQMIAELGGWTTVDSLKAYLRNTSIETARAAKSLPFFR